MTTEQIAKIKAMLADAERQRDEAQAAYLRLDGAVQTLRIVLHDFGAGEQPAPIGEAE